MCEYCLLQLDMVLRLGVSPDRIVFANACKRPRDIRAAAAKQVCCAPTLTESTPSGFLTMSSTIQECSSSATTADFAKGQSVPR